jgi:hypothetical protein
MQNSRKSTLRLMCWFLRRARGLAEGCVICSTRHPLRLALLGITAKGAAALESACRWSASSPLSPISQALGAAWSKSGAATVISAIWPPIKWKASGWPARSIRASILVVRPPRERPMALAALSPFAHSPRDGRAPPYCRSSPPPAARRSPPSQRRRLTAFAPPVVSVEHRRVRPRIRSATPSGIPSADGARCRGGRPGVPAPGAHRQMRIASHRTSRSHKLSAVIQTLPRSLNRIPLFQYRPPGSQTHRRGCDIC